MKKIVYRLLLALTVVAFTACSWDSEDKNPTHYDTVTDELKAIESEARASSGINLRWRELNEQLHDSIAKKALSNTVLDWHAVSTPGGTAGVYVRFIKSGTGSEKPVQTASVVINYKGKLGSETVFDQGVGAKFAVNGVVTGFSTALQNMVTGDKWEVCIPYGMGYGYTTSGSIPACSTLFFEIELLEIDQYPQ
ncbi:MAG: FKBP-type peptidyl-prolyl cis-trans isomerase [Candidatus Symbiothrix sp.]|jgi:FKBP-type peptidyl-prolyl cis-trans isomerase|nr:FKBP-type peptidyl-prolyl cis-trans isomerase [Candidatus Symbiothrix sp.]